MAIDQFTKQQFEDALLSIHPGAESIGNIDGEEVYIVPVNENARLKIRSSVDQSGYAADVSKDSIRLWIEIYQPHWRNGNTYEWQAASKKTNDKTKDAYVTRVPGWKRRLEAKIRKLWDKAVTVRKAVEPCQVCGTKKAWFVNKDGKNKNRPFASCKCEKGFEWLDTDGLEKGSKDVFIDTKELESESSHIPAGTGQDQDIVQQGTIQDLDQANTLLSEDTSSQNVQEMLERISGYEQLNDAQYIAATASIDANIRLLAPPGSGKTHTVKYRYQFLVENGIDPDNILVVTFSKPMADEMGQKIVNLVPFANVDQISTIHAFCYRLLRNWYDTPYSGYNYPKQGWKVKSILEDLIGIVWQDKEKPNYTEVLDWIDSAKYHNQFNQDFFIDRLGYRFGNWLWEIASRFQRTMQSNKEMLFSDMLMYTEQLLENDDQFRDWCHNRFKQIIIDEAQDTNFQAMRILIAISENCQPNEVNLKVG